MGLTSPVELWGRDKQQDSNQGTEFLDRQGTTSDTGGLGLFLLQLIWVSFTSQQTYSQLEDDTLGLQHKAKRKE